METVCPHMRPFLGMCPHCNGMNAYPGEDSRWEIRVVYGASSDQIVMGAAAMNETRLRQEEEDPPSPREIKDERRRFLGDFLDGKRSKGAKRRANRWTNPQRRRR